MAADFELRANYKHIAYLYLHALGESQQGFVLDGGNGCYKLAWVHLAMMTHALLHVLEVVYISILELRMHEVLAPLSVILQHRYYLFLAAKQRLPFAVLFLYATHLA